MSRITARFQQRAIEKLFRVPEDLSCPCCHHSYEIEVSRRQLMGNIVSRRLWRHYHCCVCDHRFRVLNLVVRFWPVGLAFPAAALLIAGFSMIH